MVGFQAQRIRIVPRVHFGDVQLFAVRMTGGVQPRSVVQPADIHHQGVVFPVADRLSQIIRIRIGGLLASVHPDDAPYMRAAFIDEQNAVGQLENLGRIRCVHPSRNAGRPTETLRIVFGVSLA